MGRSLLETDGKPVETGAKRHVHLKDPYANPP